LRPEAARSAIEPRDGGREASRDGRRRDEAQQDRRGAPQGSSREQAQDDGRDESQPERLDRNQIELLNELRVAGTGIQVLLAFLLVAPFDSRFERLSSFERYDYFVSLLCIAVAAALLIAPALRSAFSRCGSASRSNAA
jgi:Family of unknown function (DUF6328)